MPVSVIIPVRNERDNIMGVIDSVKGALKNSQLNFEIVIVDDNSTDGTYEILKGLEDIKLIRITEKPQTAVGKNFALWKGFKVSKGDVLLFLDADVKLEQSSLERILPFLRDYDLVSVSPRQETGSPFEASLQPFVFKFLSSIYPLERIKDPKSSVAAANGQFILIKRGVYEKVCGHKAVISQILEDVEFARNVKLSGFRILLLNGKDYGVRCRMYKGFKDLINGWSKNLFLLSYKKLYLPLTFGFMHLFEALAIVFLTVYFAFVGEYGLASGVFLLGNLYTFYAFRNHYQFYTVIHLLVGSLLFIFVSLRSYYWIKFKGAVYWKGRWVKIH
ncbi:MAG: glycosyltransferase family 2 protein [candidate division WOR-3 bacterium]